MNNKQIKTKKDHAFIMTQTKLIVKTKNKIKAYTKVVEEFTEKIKEELKNKTLQIPSEYEDELNKLLKKVNKNTALIKAKVNFKTK